MIITEGEKEDLKRFQIYVRDLNNFVADKELGCTPELIYKGLAMILTMMAKTNGIVKKDFIEDLLIFWESVGEINEEDFDRDS